MGILIFVVLLTVSFREQQADNLNNSSTSAKKDLNELFNLSDMSIDFRVVEPEAPKAEILIEKAEELYPKQNPETNSHQRSIGDEYLLSNLRFANSVFKVLTSVLSENFVFSPLSLQLILSWVMNEANLITAEEISKAIFLPADYNRLKLLSEYINENMKGLGMIDLYFYNDLSMAIVNSNGTNTKIAELFGGGPSFVASSKLKEWISTYTPNSTHQEQNSMVLTLLPKASMANNLNTRFRLMDKGFYPDYRQNETTQYVHLYFGTVKYYHDEKLMCKFVELPFTNEDFSLVLAIPQQTLGRNTINNEVFRNFSYFYETAKLTIETVARVRVPRTVFGNTGNIHLEEVLKSVGIKTAFTEKANFKKLSRTPIHIDKVIQKTFILINTPDGGLQNKLQYGKKKRTADENYLEVEANVPFLYFIKHKTLGVLFIGKYLKP